MAQFHPTTYVSASSDTTVSEDRPLHMNVVPTIHYGRWIVGTVVLALFVMMCVSLYENPKIDHESISNYMFAGAILKGAEATVVLAVLSQLIGIVLGTVLAIMRLSANVVLSSVSWVYIWFFRGTPLLVQILFWGNFALLFDHIVLGIPYTTYSLLSWDTNHLITTFVASILGLGLNEAAYMAEIVRAGLLSVDEGQDEAAASLGIRRLAILRHITLPQAMRVVIPPTGNQFLSMIKATSLVYVIAGEGLLTTAQNISATNLRVVELLVVASAWFLLLTSVSSVGQFYLERRFSRGSVRNLPLTPVQRVLARLTRAK